MSQKLKNEISVPTSALKQSPVATSHITLGKRRVLRQDFKRMSGRPERKDVTVKTLFRNVLLKHKVSGKTVLSFAVGKT